MVRRMHAQDQKSHVIFRRAGQVVRSSAAPWHGGNGGATGLTVPQIPRMAKIDCKNLCEGGAGKWETAQHADSDEESKKKQYSEMPHTEAHSTALKEEGDATHMMALVSQQTALLPLSEDTGVTASAEHEYLDNPSETHPELQSPHSQSTVTASSSATSVEAPRAGQRITKRAFPSTLAWFVFINENVFHESHVSPNHKLNSKGIEGTFYLRMHETWRCVRTSTMPP